MSRNAALKVVIGLGKTGLSCVNYLVSQGHRVAVVDSRTAPPALQALQEVHPEVDIQLGAFDEALLTRASELIISPGVSCHEPAIAKQLQRNIPIVGDIELFARHTTKPIVAVTGSNGKSTVTSLLGHLAAKAGLKVSIGGNLGRPALDLLHDSHAELYILELSSFQLETTYTLRCLSSVNLNISADHLDRYPSIQDYIRAKLRIYRDCAHPVINLDDPRSHAGFNFATQPRGFTLKKPAQNVYGITTLRGEPYLAYGNKPLIAAQSLPLRGQHQQANVLASLAIGSAIGLPIDTMLHALPSFTGLPHRCQWVANIDGVDWYNDSKATNVGSTQAAILGIGPEIKGKIILLAGGDGKNADFCDLYDAVQAYAKTLILYGKDKLIIAKALAGAAPIIIADDFPAVITLAQTHAQAGDAVLLAPACASYDMFRNFEHRGEAFMQLVRGLKT